MCTLPASGIRLELSLLDCPASMDRSSAALGAIMDQFEVQGFEEITEREPVRAHGANPNL